MFLNQLGNEEGKKFFELANIAMNVDGIQHEDEKRILKFYEHDLMIEGYTLENNACEELLEFFSGKPDKIRKIVVFELMGVLCCDGEFPKVEQDWINNVANKLGVTEKFVQDAQTIVEGLIYCAKKADSILNA